MRSILTSGQAGVASPGSSGPPLATGTYALKVDPRIGRGEGREEGVVRGEEGRLGGAPWHQAVLLDGLGS